MKKLTYIIHSIEVGGAEVALLSAIPELTRNFDLTVLVIGNFDRTLFNKISDINGLKIITLNISKYLALLNKRRIYKIIQKTIPDILIASLWCSYFLGTYYKKKNEHIKYFVFIHASNFFHFIDKLFSKKAIIIADTIFVDSNATYNFVLSLKIQQKEPQVISFLTNSTPAWNKRDFPKDGIFKMIHLGTIAKVKNLPLTIKVIDSLNQKGFNVYLDIYGKNGDAKKEVLNKINHSPFKSNYRLKGIVNPNDRFKLLMNYHFLIQLSKTEGMAMSVAESMQQGLPCIVTPVGEIPNYSQDMESAIFLRVQNNKIRLLDFTNLLRVLNNKNLYEDISRNSNKNFTGKEIFANSLINAINRNIEVD